MLLPNISADMKQIKHNAIAKTTSAKAGNEAYYHLTAVQ